MQIAELPKELVIQVNGKTLRKCLPSLVVKFCYDVYSGCEVDETKVEARFDPQDKDEADRIYNGLCNIHGMSPVKNW